MMKKHKIIPQDLPKGRIVEVYGDVDVGKTRTVLTMISELSNKTCLYVDADHDLTKDKLLKYDVQDIVTVFQPSTVEQVSETLLAFLKHGAFDIIVIDSTANLVPESLTDLPVAQITGRQRTKAITAMVQALIPIVEQQEATVIFISQTRQNHDGTVYSTGGKALRFYATVRFLITEDDIVVVKNKTDMTLLKAQGNTL